MRLILLLILCAAAAWGAACTATATGTWATATWSCGHEPIAGDTVTINSGVVVTIPEGVSVTVGDGTATNAISISGTLTQNGTLTLNSHLNLASGGTYEVVAVASVPVLTMVSSATVNPLIKGYAGTVTFRLVGTAANWARVVGDNSAGGYSQLDVRVGLPYLRYVQLEGLGSPTQNSNSASAVSIDSDHVRVLNCGRFGLTPTATSVVLIRHWDWRSGANSSTAYTLADGLAAGPALTTGTREISDSTFYRNQDFLNTNAVLYLGSPDYSLLRNVFYNVPLKFAVTALRTAMDRPLFVGQGLGTAQTTVPGNGGVQTTNGAFLQHGDTAATNNNGHTVSFDDNDRGVGPNVWDNCVRDAAGYDGVGDFLMTARKAALKNSIFVANGGNLVDGLYASAEQTVEHNTSHLFTTAWTGFGPVVISESGTAATKAKSIRSNIFTSEGQGVEQGPAFDPQDEDFVLDYNVGWDLNQTALLYNPTTGAKGVLRAGSNVRKTATAAIAGTSATTLVFAGTSLGVVVGDFALFNVYYAPVLTVVEGGGNTTYTLGIGNTATAGIPGLVATNSVTCYKRYWASGGLYGAAGKGANDITANPRYIDPTRTQLTWDVSLGGPGTVGHVADEVVKLNGLDKDSAAAAFNPAYSIDAYLRYIRRGLMPTNLAIKGRSHDGTDPGAVTMTIYNAPGITGGGVY